MPLCRLTSFKLDGVIPSVIVCESKADLDKLPSYYTPIGAGSNALICPSINYPLVKVSPQFLPITSNHDGIITVSAGMPIASALNWMAEHEWSGLEFAAGVPATIGGMIAMNFECWGQEMSAILRRVLVYSTESGLKWLDRSEVSFGYRTSSFQGSDWLICGAEIQASSVSKSTIKHRISRYIRQRKEKQPISQRTFGSVFMNPQNYKVGYLIESLGMKGFRIGDVMISNHHANFFENINSATFDDTIKLIQRIKEAVYNHYNVALSCEVKIIS